MRMSRSGFGRRAVLGNTGSARAILAADRGRKGALGLGLAMALTAGLVVWLLAVPAAALDAIAPLAQAAAQGDVASEACPALTRVKYPFLHCTRDTNGQLVLAATGDASIGRSRLPAHDPFVSGGGPCSGRGRRPSPERCVSGDGQWGPEAR